MHILKRFEFEPSLMRSGVVAAEGRHGRPTAHGVLIIKGAAAVIERMVGSDKLPHNYRKVRLKIVCKAANLEPIQHFCFSAAGIFEILQNLVPA